jgi:hypothetical protein
VIQLFEYLCRYTPELRKAQRWLKDNGFLSILVKELETCEDSIGDSIADRSACRFSAYLHLIEFCISNPVFADVLCSARMVSILNRSVGQKPRFVEDARWRALEALYCPRTVEMMRGLFQSAVELLRDGDACRTQSSHSALRILQKMLAMDSLIKPFVLDAGVPGMVMDLMTRNPDHSILHERVRSLMVALFQDKSTRAMTIATCVGMIVAAGNSENQNLRASAHELVRAVLKLGIGMREMQAATGFAELLKTVQQRTSLIAVRFVGMSFSL